MTGVRFDRNSVAAILLPDFQAVELVEEVRERDGRRYNKMYYLYIDNITENFIREKDTGVVANRPLR